MGKFRIVIELETESDVVSPKDQLEGVEVEIDRLWENCGIWGLPNEGRDSNDWEEMGVTVLSRKVEAIE